MIIGGLDTKKIVVTDFETYYDDVYTLRAKNKETGQKMRAEEYILDRRFKCHGMGVAYANGKTDFIDGEDIPKWLKTYKKHTIVNHKMTFDGLIWRLRYDHLPRLCAIRCSWRTPSLARRKYLAEIRWRTCRCVWG